MQVKVMGPWSYTTITVKYAWTRNYDLFAGFFVDP